MTEIGIVIKNGKIAIYGLNVLRPTAVFPATVDFSSHPVTTRIIDNNAIVTGYLELLSGQPLSFLKSKMAIIYKKGTQKLYYNLTIDGIQHYIDIETVLLKLLAKTRPTPDVPDRIDVVLSVPQRFPVSLQKIYSELAESVGYDVSALIGEMDGFAYAYRDFQDLNDGLNFIVIDVSPLDTYIGAYRTESHKVISGKFIRNDQINDEMLAEVKNEFFDGIIDQTLAKNDNFIPSPDQKMQNYVEAIFQTYQTISEGLEVHSIALHADIFVQQAVRERFYRQTMKIINNVEGFIAKGIVLAANSSLEKD